MKVNSQGEKVNFLLMGFFNLGSGGLTIMELDVCWLDGTVPEPETSCGFKLCFRGRSWRYPTEDNSFLLVDETV